MISFRVSADYSPILSKQFEPNFEALDLLQMHNRNFVINMVINGEKTPAFSARTLNLPPAQADNSAAIIENTRRLYSRSRAEVEQEISELIKPRAGAPAAQPPQPNVTTWPINAQTQTVTPDSTGAQEDTAQPAVTPPAKKKRTRSRKRKSSSTTTESAEKPANSAKKPKLAGALPEKGVAEIQLR